MGEIVLQEIGRHLEEEKITGRCAARLEDELRRRGFSTWLFQQPDKAKWEGRLGADLAVMLLDQDADVMKAALVQAKRADQLNRTDKWCDLVEQCRKMAAELRHSSWVWVYDNPPASSRAVRANEVLAIHAHIASGDPCEGTGHFEQPGWVVLGRTKGRTLGDWFTELLTCYVARRAPLNAAVFGRWLRTVSPRRLLLVATSGDVPTFLSEISDMYHVAGDGQESHE